MKDLERNPQINISKIPIGGNAGGLIAAIGAVLILLLGIPELRFIAPLALGGGVVIALVLRFTRRKPLGGPWILPAPKK